MLGTGRLAVMTIFAVLVLAHSAWAEPTEIPDRPPRLTFDKHVDYVAWYNDFVRRGRDEKDNAYPLYLKLCPDKDGQCGFPEPEGEAQKQFDAATDWVWTKEEFPELAAYLEECEPYFAIFEDALKKPGCWIPADPKLKRIGDMYIPVGYYCKRLIAAMTRRVWMDTPQRGDAMIGHWRRSLRYAEHLDDTSMWMETIRARLCRRDIHDQALAALESGVLAGKELEVYGLLSTPEVSSDARWRSMMIDWAYALGFVQYCVERGGPDPSKWVSNRQLIEELGYYYTEEIEKIGFTFNIERALQWIEVSNSTAIHLVQTGRFKEIENQIVELQRELWKDISTAEIFSYRFTIGTPGFYSNASSDRDCVHRRGTLLVLSLHAYQNRYAKWPSSLDAVDSAMKLRGFGEATIDPYSDKPFVYKLKDGKPVLYSVGVNGVDDGGVRKARFGDVDLVFWPYERPETK
jgi:hypothetical protein